VIEHSGKSLKNPKGNQRKEGTMKRWIFCLFVLMAVLSVTFSGVGKGAAAESPIVLKAVCFLPKTNSLSAMTLEWVDRMNKMFKGQLKIEYRGGPETIPAVEQVEALRKGIIDINFNVGSYYAPQGAEFNAFQLSKLSPSEERKSGFYDFMVKAHEKIGVRYLGRWLHGGFHMYLKEPITTVESLKGKKIRTGPLYVFFLNKLGAAPVSIKPADVYTSLQRGLVEGFCWPILGARESGWTEICKYIIDHPFYEGDGTILFNEKKWESLPASVRDKITKTMPNYENDMVKYYDQEITKERGLLAKGGAQFIKFDPKEAEKFTNMAYDAWWEFMMTKVPDLVPELKKMTGN
jgi:TRAP-type C4-dicarboxylate transport system substrate-binding protein